MTFFEPLKIYFKGFPSTVSAVFGGGGFDSFATESDVKSFKETEKEEVKNFSLEILEKMFAEKILQVSN